MLQSYRSGMQQLNQNERRQSASDQQLLVSTPHRRALQTAFVQGKPVWIMARGHSMRPLWDDGARLLVGPVTLSQLLPGDLVLCASQSSDQQLIAHRLIGRRCVKASWQFRTKADARCAVEPWLPADALVGRVLTIQEGRRQRVVDRGLGLWRERVIGVRERVHVMAHEWWARRTPVCVVVIPQAAPLTAADRHRRWAHHALLQYQLLDCIRLLREIDCRPMVLKGMALIAAGEALAEERELGDIDVLVPPETLPRLRQYLDTAGYRIREPRGPQRRHCSRAIVCESPQGVIFDVHWQIINAGWRFGDILRVDHEQLWVRARCVTVEGHELRVLGLEDQLLHLCMHLILSRGTDPKWWHDIQRFITRHHATLDWAMFLERARAWHVQTIMWLVGDVLTHSRASGRLPLDALCALRPVWWQRIWLRRMLQQGFSERDSRIRQGFYELLLMDTFGDALRLLRHYLFRPRAWSHFHRNK